MSTASNAKTDTPEDFRIPLVFAVTGHRDLVASEIPEIRARVRALLSDFAERYQSRRLVVLSALAEGADRVVAEEALALGLDLVVPLPMPRALYVTDFETPESVDRFDELCDQAREVFELPLAKDNRLNDIEEHGPKRNLQYAQLGVFICAHCHVLIALWDGKPSDELGGTAQVVKFLHDDVMPGYTTATLSTQQALIDDESDLAYHIVCSRDRPGGAPQPGLQPLECWWFTKDRDAPRSKTLNDQHKLIFKRSSEFSDDALAFAERIEAEKYSLLEDRKEESLPPGAAAINRIFCIADWLAIHYQKRYFFSLRATHALAFLMGLMFILYTDLQTYQYFMLALLAFFALAAAIQFLAGRGAWHRKYLDYRALAEGLRVQFYWAVAGVRGESESKFAHDIFLQSQDPELGWIRNIMRAAGLRSDAVRSPDKEGLEFAIREWVGDSNGGQLAYFGKKVGERLHRTRVTDRLAVLTLVVSFVVIAAIMIWGDAMPGGLQDVLITVMGAMLLLLGIRHGYAYSVAEKELLKQYDFMLRIFGNARQRLDRAADDAERCQILKGLGMSALNEHAEWILLHRDRSPDTGEIWLMGQ